MHGEIIHSSCCILHLILLNNTNFSHRWCVTTNYFLKRLKCPLSHFFPSFLRSTISPFYLPPTHPHPPIASSLPFGTFFFFFLDNNILKILIFILCHPKLWASIKKQLDLLNANIHEIGTFKEKKLSHK